MSEDGASPAAAPGFAVVPGGRDACHDPVTLRLGA